jgi:hypothetical protein
MDLGDSVVVVEEIAEVGALETQEDLVTVGEIEEVGALETQEDLVVGAVEAMVDVVAEVEDDRVALEAQEEEVVDGAAAVEDDDQAGVVAAEMADDHSTNRAFNECVGKCVY